MKPIIFLFSLGIVFFTSSCALQRTTFYKAPDFDTNASFKVITLNSNDVLSGRIEHFLLVNNFKVISDNSFRVPMSGGFPSPVFPTDTSLYRPGQVVVNIPYMEEKPSDYILRYQFDNAEDGNSRSSLNIAVVNTHTGQVEVSYLAERSGRLEGQDIDRIVRNVISRMKGR